MSVDQRELGERLRRAREACGMTQEEVGGHLGVSRSTIAQMELGNRRVSGLELSELAYLYAKDLRSFVSIEEPAEEGALAALFRLHPDLATEQDIRETLRRCMGLGRELTGLERLLKIDRDLTKIVVVPLPQPSSKWEAIEQGERLALDERRRLGLGLAPLPDVADLLEAQGVRTAQISFPDDISGLTLIEPEIGLFVAVNRDHHFLRRRFSFAHEYCHLLADRERQGVVSRGQDRAEFLEVRANAFAAAFLMPEEATRQIVLALGKGRPSRMEADVFDEVEAVRTRARAAPGSQEIQLYDVVQVAHHFRVSIPAASYRLKSLRLVTREELSSLLKRDALGHSRQISTLLGLPEPDHEELRNQFTHRFLGLALEAYRRDDISRSKLIELAGMVGHSLDDFIGTMEFLGEREDEPAEVQLPEE